MMPTLFIAKTAYEAAQQYRRDFLAYKEPDWEELDAGQKERVLSTVEDYALGEQPLDASHEQWREAEEAHGWKYAPLYSKERKENPALIPWVELAPQLRRAHAYWGAVVKALW